MMDTKEALKELEDLTVDYGNRNEEQIARLDEAIDMAIDALKAQEVSNNSPKVDSDSGELIRCKKCRYKKRKGVDYFCDHITGEEIMVSPNDYCSWAEREVKQ